MKATRGLIHRGSALAALTCLATAAWGFAVYGAIGDKYRVLGREAGVLGAPRSDEAPAPHGGRFNAFDRGFIYWHPDTGAFAVWGAIGQKWDQLGRVAYGYPITDESPTPDGRGRFNHFRALHLPGKPEASIYWTPQTGAQAVYGQIRQKWASEGWERGRVGYPIGDEVADGPYRRNAFERGFIRWSSATGTEVVPTGVAPTEAGPFGGAVVNGIAAFAELPTGGRREMYADRTLLAPAEMCARFLNQSNLNERFRDTLIQRIRPEMPSGFGVHSQSRHTMGTSCLARAEIRANNTIAISLRVPGNQFRLRATTPDGFPGSWDPSFDVTYDLVMRTSLKFPGTVAGSIVQDPIEVSGENVSRPRPANFTGDVANSLNIVYQLLGGSDFFGAVSQSGATRLPGVDIGGASLNQQLTLLRGYAPPGTRLELLPQDGLAVVLATTRPPAPGPR